MATYGYVRVSTKAQADEGLSLEAQQRQLEGYAMMLSLTVDHLFQERGVSGFKPIGQRPEGRKLLATLQPGDVVLCAKLDRMFRSARDALDVADFLKKRGVSLHLLDLGGDVTGNGISKVFFTILAALAEFERDRTAERIADVKANEKSKGRFLGGSRPFGWQIVDGSLVPDAAEQAVVTRVHQLRRDGVSLRGISQKVATDGLALSHVTIKRILTEEPWQENE